MRWLVAAAFAVSLSACGQSVVTEPDPEAAAVVGESVPIQRELPPRSAETPRYVGRWAVSEENCNQHEWIFQEDRMTAPGEVLCRFDNVTMSNSGYMIDATCSTDQPPARHNIQLAFAESARALLVTGGPWQGEETGLVYCGPLTP